MPADDRVARHRTRRAYVDRPIGDVALASEVAARAADRLGLGHSRLRHVGMNAIFEVGDVVLRVGRPSAAPGSSIELAERLRAAGIRVNRPVGSGPIEDRGLAVTSWERIVPTGEPTDWDAVGEMVRRVHRLPIDVIPAGYPAPSPAAFPWWDFETLLVETAASIDAAAHDGLRAAIDRHPGWHRFDDVVVCHGDVHPGNVMMAADGPVLIDWDLLCLAPPGWDHAPLMPWTERWGGPPGMYESFAAGYGWSARGDRWAEAFAELRLVAATLMRVKADVDRREPETERRLRYWRGDPDAPVWYGRGDPGRAGGATDAAPD